MGEGKVAFSFQASAVRIKIPKTKFQGNTNVSRFTAFMRDAENFWHNIEILNKLEIRILKCKNPGGGVINPTLHSGCVVSGLRSLLHIAIILCIPFFNR